MDELLRTLADFIKSQGVGTSIIAFLAWFFTARAWPWLTTIYFPAMQAERNLATTKIDAQTAALVEVKVAMVQAVIQLQSLKETTLATQLSLLEHRSDFQDAIHRMEERVAKARGNSATKARKEPSRRGTKS